MGANPLNMIPCAERTALRECQDRILARTILHDEPASAALNEPESSAKGCGLIAAPRDLFVHPITLTNEHSPALCPVAPVNLPVLPEEGALARLRRPRNLRRRGFRSRLQLRLGNFHRCALRCCLRLGLRFGLCFSLGRWLLGAIFSCRATRVIWNCCSGRKLFGLAGTSRSKSGLASAAGWALALACNSGWAPVLACNHGWARVLACSSGWELALACSSGWALALACDCALGSSAMLLKALLLLFSLKTCKLARLACGAPLGAPLCCIIT